MTSYGSERGESPEPSQRNLMSDNLGDYKTTTAIMNEEKSRKLQKIAAMSNSGNNTSFGGGDDGKSKGANTQEDLKFVKKMLEEVTTGMKSLHARIDQQDVNQREMSYAQLEMDQKNEVTKKGIDAGIGEMSDQLKAMIKCEEEARNRQVVELQQGFNLREKKITQTIMNEVGEEATARIAVASDLAKVSENMKDLRASLSDESSRLQAKISCLQTKTTTTFSDMNDLMAAERSERERMVKACKTDAAQRFAEMRSKMEARCKELSKEQKAAHNQLTFIVDSLRQDTVKSLQKSHELLEEKSAKSSEKIDHIQMTLEGSARDIRKMFEDRLSETSQRLNDLDGMLNRETGQRIQEDKQMMAEFAQECIQREKDEAAIVNTLETLMRRIKQA